MCKEWLYWSILDENSNAMIFYCFQPVVVWHATFLCNSGIRKSDFENLSFHTHTQEYTLWENISVLKKRTLHSSVLKFIHTEPKIVFVIDNWYLNLQEFKVMMMKILTFTCVKFLLVRDLYFCINIYYLTRSIGNSLKIC